jgi:hypothetical protein
MGGFSSCCLARERLANQQMHEKDSDRTNLLNLVKLTNQSKKQGSKRNLLPKKMRKSGSVIWKSNSRRSSFVEQNENKRSMKGSVQNENILMKGSPGGQNCEKLDARLKKEVPKSMHSYILSNKKPNRAVPPSLLLTPNNKRKHQKTSSFHFQN